jgi:hypothetical protein
MRGAYKYHFRRFLTDHPGADVRVGLQFVPTGKGARRFRLERTARGLTPFRTGAQGASARVASRATVEVASHDFG